MTVGAHGPEIRNRIDPILFPDLREWPQVVNMDQATHFRSVPFLKTQSTYDASSSVVIETPPACFGIPLIRVHEDGSTCTLHKMWNLVASDLVRKLLICWIDPPHYFQSLS